MCPLVRACERDGLSASSPSLLIGIKLMCPDSLLVFFFCRVSCFLLPSNSRLEKILNSTHHKDMIEQFFFSTKPEPEDVFLLHLIDVYIRYIPNLFLSFGFRITPLFVLAFILLSIAALNLVSVFLFCFFFSLFSTVSKIGWVSHVVIGLAFCVCLSV